MAKTKAAMVKASRIVLNGFELRVERQSQRIGVLARSLHGQARGRDVESDHEVAGRD